MDDLVALRESAEFLRTVKATNGQDDAQFSLASVRINRAAARIQALETSLAEAEGRVKAITIALHDAIRRPMGQVPESADPFYSPAMAEQAEARRVARSQALSELAALETGDSPSPPPVV